MKRILLVEDDPAIRAGLIETLESEHFAVVVAQTGEEGLSVATTAPVDLILLDLMLPEMNGDEVCRELRSRQISTPIIMLTARGEEVDRVIGLEIGADDYVTKPFSPRELVARIRAVLRRGGAPSRDLDEVRFGQAHIDFRSLEARCGSTLARLTPLESRVLRYLIGKPGEVVTRDMLLDDVWGYDSYPTTRTVDNTILSLRKKVEVDPSKPQHLRTVQGMGYRFVMEPDPAPETAVE